MNSEQRDSSAGYPGAHQVKRDRSDYIIQKVLQALNILEQFHDDVDELSPNELSRRLSLNEGALGMLLATLKSRYYLEENASTGKYRLGYKNLELAQTVLRQTDLYRVSHPVLASISARCGESVAVAVLRKSHVIELDAIQSEHPVQVVSRVGDHLPVHCTAAGKAIIACYAADMLQNFLSTAELKLYTPATITCPERLKLELEAILDRGYAIEYEELDREVRAVAAPIHDYAGAVVGAVVVTAPSCRMGEERMAGELASLVQQGAEEISARLGFHATQLPCSTIAQHRQDPRAVKKSRRPGAPRKPKRATVRPAV